MTYVMSDVHGCYRQYRAMLEKIQFCSGDTLYLLGDLADRQNSGVEILQDAMRRHNVIPLLGNHELTAAVCLPWLMEQITEQSLNELGEEQIAALREWILNGGGPTLRALKALPQEEREEILEYLREMELYREIVVEGKIFVLTHSGLENFAPGKPLDAYALTDFLFDRPSLGRAYFPDKLLVFGHTPTRVLRQQAGMPPSDEILRWGNQVAIDCGCCFGGKLGCLCLETMEEFYI